MSLPEILLVHTDELRRCRGAVCYAALAVHYGTISPAVLEGRVRRRGPYVTANGERSWSGVYRRWLRDGVAPSNRTSDQVYKRTGGSVDLAKWRDLPLWKLLTPYPQLLSTTELLWDRFPRQVGQLAFGDVTRPRPRKICPTPPDVKRILALRNLRSLDAFLALVHLAREAERLGSEYRHVLPAFCAYDLLPRLFYRYPQLRHSWKDLFACIERVLSRKLAPEPNAPSFPFAAERVEIGLQTLIARPDASLAQVSDDLVQNQLPG